MCVGTGMHGPCVGGDPECQLSVFHLVDRVVASAQHRNILTQAPPAHRPPWFLLWLRTAASEAAARWRPLRPPPARAPTDPPSLARPLRAHLCAPRDEGRLGPPDVNPTDYHGFGNSHSCAPGARTATPAAARRRRSRGAVDLHRG